ncbi:hypothetical protein NM688_g5107 [Phlebia brevispora]|uniref:Uncharacterized protein n=1 Tax=Phlebia brevispora TaxID=194682 RepID=A0ACC1T0R6_9APHY|nr:hypothetical protein NM688_g5107 [Phlebia brevispora]
MMASQSSPPAYIHVDRVRFDQQGRIRCYCDDSDNFAEKRISRSIKNPDRPYWRCKKDQGACRFYKFDDELPPNPILSPVTSQNAQNSQGSQQAFHSQSTESAGLFASGSQSSESQNLKRSRPDTGDDRPITPPMKRLAVFPVTPVSPYREKVITHGRTQEMREQQDLVSSQETLRSAQHLDRMENGMEFTGSTENRDSYRGAPQDSVRTRPQASYFHDSDAYTTLGDDSTHGVLIPPRSSSHVDPIASRSHTTLNGPEESTGARRSSILGHSGTEVGDHHVSDCLAVPQIISADEVETHISALQGLPDCIRYLQKKLSNDETVIEALSTTIEVLTKEKKKLELDLQKLRARLGQGAQITPD